MEKDRRRNEFDKEIHFHIHEVVTPLRDRLVKVETKVEVVENSMKELSNDMKEVKTLMKEHVQDEQHYWNTIRDSIQETAVTNAKTNEKMNALRWWIVSGVALIAAFISLAEKFFPSI